uniref:Uncharacterized protein n=1 Tax=Anguilla anguilla TaxID=7936 RepID=A0A0E9WF81_ANGAN
MPPVTALRTWRKSNICVGLCTIKLRSKTKTNLAADTSSHSESLKPHDALK